MSAANVSPRRPHQIGLITDADLVRHGIQSLLAPHTDRVRLVEPGAAATPVDLVLVDRWSPGSLDGGLLLELLNDPRIRHVALYTRVQEGVEDGAPGPEGLATVSVRLSGPQLVSALEELCTAPPRPRRSPVPLGTEAGLTPRQAEIISLITTGLTNRDIVERTGLSENTIKSYIRGAYSRIGATTRAQAVRWGMEHCYLRRPRVPSG